MNFRTKAFGLVSALAIAATMTVGVASAADPVMTSVQLNDSSAPGVCTLAVVGSGTFGHLDWNPATGRYEGTPSDIGLSGTLTHTGSPSHRPCGISVEATGLGDAFPATALTLVSTDLGLNLPLTGGVQTILATNTDIGNPSVSGTGLLKLDASKVVNTVAPGTKAGTLTFTVNQGS